MLTRKVLLVICMALQLVYLQTVGCTERLRKWHNIDTQLGTEGEEANTGNGVLNPALLSIRKKDTK